ncbi:MAG: hypothetical protein QOG21_1015 [Actinomycetota bacterium]|jgi:uncharacterized repeat protein (TIGR03847 family)|nr:hypothetical protein [Actinomycetota bacterium]
MNQDFTPEIFTADYTGRPGARVFYIQARGDFGSVTYLVEKQQVAVLADKLRELLVMVDAADTVAGAEPARDPALALTEPTEPEWRIGMMGLTYEEAEQRVLVLVRAVEEQTSDEEPVLDDDEDEPGVQFHLRRDQVRAFILHALAVVAEGRPLCQLCGLPIDPEGHICPASNGHRPPT